MKKLLLKILISPIALLIYCTVQFLNIIDEVYEDLKRHREKRQ